MKPILFSAAMVKAILSGAKTQTRRVVTARNSHTTTYFNELDFSKAFVDGFAKEGLHYLKVPNPTDGTRHRVCPKWVKGDRLWVREMWRGIKQEIGQDRYEYKASENINTKSKWRPSIFMPRIASRITLEIVKVRVERLQDISDEDAIAEGIGDGFQMNAGWPDYQHIKNGICAITQDTAEMSFASLWSSINGAESWDANPWVWVIEFKRL